MIDLEDFLADAGIDAHTMEYWFTREWIVRPGAEAGAAISEVDAARATFIRDLTQDFGVNDEGVEIALHLVDQVHGLRRMLFALRMEMRTPLV